MHLPGAAVVPFSMGRLNPTWRWWLIVTAILATIGMLRIVGAPGASPAADGELDTTPGLTDRAVDRDTGRVAVVMRNVDYQIDDDITLAITGLQGALLPRIQDSMPVLDDPTSFAIALRDAEIAIDTASLGRLLNRYVFAYEGSPLRDLTVSVEDGLLVQKGSLVKIVPVPFTIRARVSVTPGGEILVAPRDIEVLGLGVRGLMDWFGLELENLVRDSRSNGVRIESDTIYLDPEGLLPSPRIQGRLRGIRLEAGRLVQWFREDSTPVAPSRIPGAGRARNYMQFRHGTLRFGKLTMHDVDLLIVDTDSTSPLVFSLERYQDQLIAGYHVTTRAEGLVVYLPDLSSLPRQAAHR